MKTVAIVILSVFAAVLFGIVHDQITTRICLEYFTIGHPKVINSESPTLLAFTWGVLATWWVGVILGFPLAVSSRVGKWPKLTYKDQEKPLLYMVMIMFACALLVGAAAFSFTHSLPPGSFTDILGPRILPEVQNRFVVVWAMHLTSYAAGFIGGITLIVRTILIRKRTKTTEPNQALEPTTLSVTFCAPSRTDRAS